jgi:hypothetical protein
MTIVARLPKGEQNRMNKLLYRQKCKKKGEHACNVGKNPYKDFYFCGVNKYFDIFLY